MKKILPLLSLTAGLLLSSVSLSTQPDIPPCSFNREGLHPCLKIWKDQEVYQNPDSVAVDTCRSSPTYQDPYASGWFEIAFVSHVVNLPWRPYGTKLDTNWLVISTDFPNIRQGFRQIEEVFGPYIMRKNAPDHTEGEFSQVFDICFENYVHVLSILNAFDSIEHTEVAYHSRLMLRPSSVPEANVSAEESTMFQIIPNPSREHVDIALTGSTPLSGQSLFLYDLFGRTVLRRTVSSSSERISIDISKLEPGAYFVRYGTFLTTLIVR